MYVKQFFENKTVSKFVIVTLAILYVLSILTCTVSFFTPDWLHDVVHIQGLGYQRFYYTYPHPYFFSNYYYYYAESFQRMCDTLGLVSGDCRYPYSDDSVPSKYEYTASVKSLDETDIRRTFVFMLITMCMLYLNLAMTISAFIFNMMDNRIYMAVLSTSYGVLYPLGAILILIVTITLEVKNPSSIGYSVILGNVSGGLMLMFYAGLRFYDDQCRKFRLKHIERDPY